MIEFSNFRHGCHLRRLSIVVDDRFPNRQVTPFCFRRVEAPRVKIFILTFRGAIGLDHEMLAVSRGVAGNNQVREVDGVHGLLRGNLDVKKSGDGSVNVMKREQRFDVSGGDLVRPMKNERHSVPPFITVPLFSTNRDSIDHTLPIDVVPAGRCLCFFSAPATIQTVF